MKTGLSCLYFSAVKADEMSRWRRGIEEAVARQMRARMLALSAA